MLRSACGVAILGVLAWSSSASAREFRVQDIPNGDKFTCLNCHGELEAKTFTNFGSQARQNLIVGGPVQEAHVEWSTLCPLDADGDGWSNGYELGDPDCTWVRGSADPGGHVTNPGDPSSSEQACDNGRLDAGEECEGAELRTTDCLAVDAGIGTLACMPDCTFDYSDCSKPPPGWVEEDDDDGGSTVEEEGCSSSGVDPSASAFGLLTVLSLIAARRLRAR